MKMIFILLDLPYLNHFDATASLPRDAFTDRPDSSPYRVRPIDKRLFDPDRAFKPFDRRFNWNAVLESPRMDDPEDMRRNFESQSSSLVVPWSRGLVVPWSRGPMVRHAGFDCARFGPAYGWRGRRTPRRIPSSSRTASGADALTRRGRGRGAHLDGQHAFAISSPAPGPQMPTPRMRSVSGSMISLVMPSVRSKVSARPTRPTGTWPLRS